MTGPNADILPGNALPLANIPVGTIIHNIELHPGNGAQLVRAAGTFAQLPWVSLSQVGPGMLRELPVTHLVDG